MKRILCIWCLWCLVCAASLGPAYADVGSLQVSGGVVVPYDPSGSDASVGWQLSYAMGVTDHLELGAMLMRTGNFEADNDITEGEVDIFSLMIQGRWLVSPEKKTRGFFDLAFGMMDVDARSPSGTPNRGGAGARLGLGVDRDLTPHLALRFSTGYTTGMGRLSEIGIVDASVSLVFGVGLFE